MCLKLRTYNKSLDNKCALKLEYINKGFIVSITYSMTRFIGVINGVYNIKAFKTSQSDFLCAAKSTDP